MFVAFSDFIFFYCFWYLTNVSFGSMFINIFESFFKNKLYKHLFLYIALEVVLIQRLGHIVEDQSRRNLDTYVKQ
jgi:hypothetical protein